MAAEKLNMSLDEIIEKKATPRSSGRARRGNPSTNNADTDAPKTRGGIRKTAGRRQPQRNPQRSPSSRNSGEKPSRRRSDRERQEDDELIAEGLRNGEFIKVSGTSSTKLVAGKIAHDARAGEPPALLAKGPTSLNQAVKAVAVARQYLQDDNADLTCQPAFRDEKQLANLALYLAKRRPIAFPKRNVVELTPNKDSNPHIVAGAIAAKVREDQPVALTAIGEQAVSICIRAICHGRLYLEEDKCDIKALVEFDVVEKKNKDVTAVRFNIIVEDV